MNERAATSTPTIDEAVAALERVKAEHRTLLDTILADEGMTAATRRALVMHLLEEEDERLVDIRSALGTAAAPTGRTLERPSGVGGLSIGSLRERDPNAQETP